MAKIELISNFKVNDIVVKNLEAIEKGLDALLITEKTLIVQRTNKGLDSNIEPFKEYAPSTKKRKIAERRNPNLVNLTDTGNMLQSLTTEVTRVGNSIIGEIYSVGFGERVRLNSELGRDFLALDKNQIARLEKQIDNLIER